MKPLMSIEYLLLLGTAIVGVGAYLSWRTSARCSGGRRVLLSVLRGVGLAILVLIAANPGAWKQIHENATEEVAVLIDSSSSMAVKDVDGESRWEVASDLQKRLQEADLTVPVENFVFGHELKSLSEDKAEPDASQTDILGAGRDLLGRYQSGKRLKAVVLLTDGRQTALGEDSDLGLRARAQECPIYPIIIGGPVPTRDIGLKVDKHQYTSFEGQKLVITATLRVQGLKQISPNLRLLGEDGKIVSEQRVHITAVSRSKVRFELDSPPAGYHQYRLLIDVWEGEQDPGNNSADVAVLVPDRKMRVFLAEGIPSWDSKFFLQHLREQKFFAVRSVYRVTNERYFLVDTEADKVSDSSTPTFPSAEEMAQYDLVILGKGADYFLDEERMSLLKSFVRDQGACLLFFRGRPYSGSFPELEELEPVRWGRHATVSYRLRPSQEGESAGLFGDVLPGARDEVWQSLPQLRSAMYDVTPKPFSTVFMQAEIIGSGQKRPALVVRRFGKGMIMTLNAEGLWQWDFFPVNKKAVDVYATLWNQLIQWAAAYSEYLPGEGLSLRLSESSVPPGRAVRASVTTRGARPETTLTVMRGREKLLNRSINFGADSKVTGALFSLSEPGTYRVQLFKKDGNAVGPARTLHVQRPPSEESNLSADPDFLADLANSSGGAVMMADQLDELVDIINRRETEQVADQPAKATWVPYWDSWWLLTLAVAVFGFEWFIRKRSGLI